MSRLLLGAAIAPLFLLSLVLTGCEQKTAEPTMTPAETAAAPPPAASEPPPADPYATDPLVRQDASQQPAVMGDTGYQQPPANPSGRVGRTHVVQRGDTLYSIARQHYNNQSRWRDIYEANRGSISDPKKLRVGQRLVIP